MTFSAVEFDSLNFYFDIDSAGPYSVNLNLYQDKGRYGSDTNKLVAPLVQGMGFVTGRYYRLTPIITSGVLFLSVTRQPNPRGVVQKWKAVLEDGKTWLIYAVPSGGSPNLELSLLRNDTLVGNCVYTGYIQIAKLSDLGKEAVIDSAAGSFAITTHLSGSVTGQQGSYTFSYSRFGQNNAGALLMYALPHHVASFDGPTASARTGIMLRAPTKGMMEAVLCDKWVMGETGLPTDITWLPLNGALMSPAARERVREVAAEEISQDMVEQSDLDSMYFSGKALGKFAQILLLIATVSKDRELACSSLVRLQSAMERFARNRQQFPLVYDNTWKGLVSKATYVKKDPNADFGNSYYNGRFAFIFFRYAPLEL